MVSAQSVNADGSSGEEPEFRLHNRWSVVSVVWQVILHFSPLNFRRFCVGVLLLFAVFVCLNVDIVMVTLTRAGFSSWTNKLCLFCSSWLRKSFSVCPIAISHLFKISDSKNVLLCISFSTLTVTSFHVFSWLFIVWLCFCLVGFVFASFVCGWLVGCFQLVFKF